jgi:hypothetical protein
MNQSSIHSTGPTPLPDIAFASVRDAVAALSTSDNLQRLALIAHRRLDRLAFCPAGQRLRGTRDPMEFVNEAISLLLREVDQPNTGRRTHPRHLRDMASFFNFVQSIVQSCISSQFKQIKRQGDHVPIGSPDSDPSMTEPMAPNDVVREIALEETTTELVQDLKQHFKDSPQIHAAVVRFEQAGLEGSRFGKDQQTDKEMHQLRTRAKEFLKSMSAREGIEQPSGKEMFGL